VLLHGLRDGHAETWHRFLPDLQQTSKLVD